MSIGSTDYKYLKYTTNNKSVNHPSHYDRDLDSSISSFESQPPPSKTQSATARISNRKVTSPSSRQIQHKARSFISEPVLKKPNAIMPLTEEVLAIHNSAAPPFQHYEYQYQLEEEQEDNIEEDEEDYVLEQSLLDRVDAKCKIMQQEFDEKIKQLEAQFTKAEQNFNSSRNEIEELSCMEKEYLNQGVQTELRLQDLKQKEKESLKVQGLQDFTEKTRQIIWDTPFIPIHSICRQLPTTVEEDDEDICSYHRERIEKYKLKLEKERNSYFYDNNATLNRLSMAIKQQNF